MSKKSLIASKLVKSVRKRAMIANDDIVYDDDTILDIVNEKLTLEVTETILDLNEEHLVYSQDIYSDGDIVIPYRAIGNKLRDLHYYWGSSNAIIEMRRIDLGELADYTYGVFPDSASGFDERSRYVFYVEGDVIKTVGVKQGKYKMYYHLSPNQVVSEEKCAKITNIDRNTGIIQFSEIPREYIELATCDLIQGNTPNKILAFDIPISNVNISQRTVTIDPSLIPSRLSVGDWVCDTQTSPYPNVPAEVHTYLAQATACQILEAIGDTENLGAAKATLKTMKKAVEKSLNNRVEGANRKLKSRHGFLSGVRRNARGIY